MKLIKEIGRNPHLDWLIILLLSAIILVMLAIGSYNLYNAVTSGDIQGTSNPRGSAAKLNEKVISAVISRFDYREEVSRKARGGYGGVADPSR